MARTKSWSRLPPHSNLSASSRPAPSRGVDSRRMSTLLATGTGPHLFWITSRAAGTAALVLSSLGVCAGLLMSGRFMRGRGADLRPLHEALSLATVAALLVHGLSLVGDN